MSFRDMQTKEPQVLLMVTFGFTDDLIRDRDLQCITVIYGPDFMYLLEQLEGNMD